MTILGIETSPTRLTISWNSAAGETYQLQFTGSLSAPTWTNLGAPIPAVGSVTSASDETLDRAPERYYRVVRVTK